VQLIHDSEAEVELMRLKVDKAREKLAQLKLALREKRGQAKGCSLSEPFSPGSLYQNLNVILAKYLL